VFLAQADHGALVALKLLHADLAEDPDVRTCFAREATAMRKASGHYSPPLLDAGVTPRPWLAMAYLPGLSLEETVTRHGPLSVDATRRVGAALAEALGSIHGAGVVHRDLKPGNILLTADGPRVIDFGNASGPALGGSDESTAPLTGTPAYMAPEHWNGGPVAFAADVFAFGRVLMFCRTGAHPSGAAPPDPSGVLHRVGDEGLEELINACLAADPRLRPGTAQLVDALSPAGTPVTVAAPPPTFLPVEG
jgi:serine/threonine protein kinase